MKQILPLLFLFILLCFPSHILAISFSIANPTLEGDYFIVDASVSGISSSSAYVQGMFTSTSSSNYFGFTWGQIEDWVDYQTTNKEFITSKLPILQKDTLQKIWIRPNFSDSGYKGPGEYFLKLKRFTGTADTSSEYSNVLTVTLSEALPTPSPTPTQIIPSAAAISPTPTVISTPTPTTSPTKTPTPTPIKTPTSSPTTLAVATPVPTKLPTVTSIITKTSDYISEALATESSNLLNLELPSVLGTSSAETDDAVILSSEHKPKSSFTNPIILKYTFIFGVIVLSLSGGLLYFRHKKD